MEPSHKQPFAGRLVLVGFGCIGQGVLPLLLRHVALMPEQILVISRGRQGLRQASAIGCEVVSATITRDNFLALLGSRLRNGDFLLNLSVDVSSVALIGLCQEIGALYLDTCIEPWAGGYTDAALPLGQRTNHALRESVLALRRKDNPQPTAVLTHGANPGLVSHLVKQALLDVAQATCLRIELPRERIAWALLAQRLNVKVIHVAERDTQHASERKSPREFVNTWSVTAFCDEVLQPAELGWGSHEKRFPADGVRHHAGTQAAIYLRRPGANTRVRSWTPHGGPMQAFLVTHAESISIADYLSIGPERAPVYRPTVHYAYHPCDDAVLSLHELVGDELRPQPRHRVLKDDIHCGMDELGVLLMGHDKGAYWYGSQLSIDQARAACPHNSATSLQVTAAVMAGVVWAMRHPMRGIVEPDDLPHDEILELCQPYLGSVVGAFTDWTPLAGRSPLYEQDIDAGDPWQFRNFRIN